MKPLKRLLYIVLPLALCIATASLGAPNIEIGSATHNFGTLHRMSKAQHVFIIKNKGTSTLRIKKIEAG